MAVRHRWSLRVASPVKTGGPRRRRPGLGALVGVLVLAGLAWLAWALFSGPEPVQQAQSGPVEAPPTVTVPAGPRELMGPPAPPAVQPSVEPSEVPPDGSLPPAGSGPATRPPRETKPLEPDTTVRRLPPVIEPDAPSFSGPKPPPFVGKQPPVELGLVDGTVFGRQVNGMHPVFLQRLREAENLARQELGPASDYGVDTIVAYRTGSRAHSTGRAVDINYYANPYIMHERGEPALNRRLADVYHRIARLMLGRDSVIPEQITLGTPAPDRTMRLFGELREESRAMISYFRLMQDREALQTHLAAVRAPTEPPYWSSLLPGGAPVTAAALQRQMMRDYVTLAGRPGPPVAGMEYQSGESAADSSGSDPPFAGDATYRGPEMGFLNLSEELVRALTKAGLHWGGTDMGRGSGDLMHFYLTASEVDATSARNRRAQR